MSELVEESFFLKFNSTFSQAQDSDSSHDQIFDGIILLIERAHIEGYNIKIQEPETIRSLRSLKAIAHIKQASFIFDLIVQIFIDLKNKKFQLRTSFIYKDRYFCIQSSPKRTITCRKLIKINNKIQLQGSKLIQDIENGKIILQLISEQPQSIFRSKDTLWNKIKLDLKKICQFCRNYTLEIIQVSNKELFKQYHIKNGGEELKKIKNQEISYTKLLKQLQISHFNFGFSSKADQTSFPSLQKCEDHEIKLKQFVMNTFCDNFEANSKKMYLANFQDFYDIAEHQITYEIESSQTKIYGSYLKNPTPRDPNPGQNKYIFNLIELVKPQSIKFQQTGLAGGINKIMIAKASFYYCDSSALDKMKTPSNSFVGIPSLFSMSSKLNDDVKQSQANPILTKILAVKVPKENEERQDERYENEKYIVRMFKNAVSAYILKYYLSSQMNFKFKGGLLVDFLPNSQPLSNYIQIFKETLSLNSKIFLIVNMTNSLRFLNDYQIVHMDLSLNNFLVFRDYLTKLIDFGEAYNSNAHKNNGAKFKRGFTFPFCSPEYFERKSNFTSKQDIFSLGMIIWRLVFNDYPFFASDGSRQSYKDKTYLKRIMLAPERGEGYGNIQAIDFIYRLLLKCLSPNEILRCEASWLTIFFKIIYFYLL